MDWLDGGWGIALLVATPAGGALTIALIDPRREDSVKTLAFLTGLMTFMWGVLAAMRWSPEPGEEVVLRPYLGQLPGLADAYHLAEFGVTVPVAALFGFLALLVLVYSWKQWKKASQAKAAVLICLLALELLLLQLLFIEGEPVRNALLIS